MEINLNWKAIDQSFSIIYCTGEILILMRVVTIIKDRKRKIESCDSVINKAESRRKKRFVIPFQKDRQSKGEAM